MNGPKSVTANFTQNQYTLVVSVSLTGSGTVTKSPNKASYVYGDVVTLTASANTGYSFSSWSGDGSGTTNSYTLTINGNKTVTANFTQNQYTLAVSATPTGSGSVTKNPDKTTYVYGDVVTLTPTPNTGYSFASWSGDASGATNPCSLTINGNKTVTANFTQNQYTLSVGVSPSGSGSVTKSPDKASYVYGDVVTLTPTPNTGYSLASWSGDISGSTNPYTLTVNGNKTVTANFVTVGVLSVTPSGGLSSSGYQGGPFSPGTQTYTLQNTGGTSINWSAGKTQGWVSLSATSGSLNSGASTTLAVSINEGANSLPAGSYSDTVTFSNVTNGNGNTTRAVSLTVNVPVQTYTVATSPAGLGITVDGTSYTGPQTFTWAVGSSHTMSVASPQSGVTGVQYVYGSWSDGGGQSHTITVPSSSTTYTASFGTQYRLTTSVSASGGGSVTPSGTNWYNSGQVVSVGATASAGYSFSGWIGDLSGSTNPSSLGMTAPKSVTANFTSIAEVLSKPNAPIGPRKAVINAKYTYSTGVATSNLDLAVEYQFDWKGDGTDLSSWSSATQSKTWAIAGNYNVRARVRCASHTM